MLSIKTNWDKDYCPFKPVKSLIKAESRIGSTIYSGKKKGKRIISVLSQKFDANFVNFLCSPLRNSNP